MAKRYWEQTVTVPAAGTGDPDWFEVKALPDGEYEAVISGGVDFVNGTTAYDHSWLLRSAPIQSAGGWLMWQFIFRRPPSGSYDVDIIAIIEDGS